MLEASHLTRHFHRHRAVDDLSFSLQPGEVVGLLGPNGAGKSTTMRMLTGFLPPDSGSVQVCGFDVQRETLQAQRMIGYLPEGAPCYGEMTVSGFLAFIAEVRGLAGAQRRQRIEETVAALELEGVLGQRIDTLSKGFRRRVGLAQAILHDPVVLILDEPTDGLDPNQKHQVRELIRRLSPGRIILISTHILEEVSALCSRVLLISGGRLLADETPFELAARSRYHQAVTLVCDHPLDEAALAALPGVAGIERNRRDHCLTLLAKDGQPILDQVHALVQARGWQLRELDVEHGRLDEVFRRLTRGESA